MTRRAFGRPGVDQRCERESLALRMTVARRDEDPDLDVEVADRPEVGPEDPELPDSFADDRTFERIAEDPPAGADATAGDTHRVDLFDVLPVDGARDAGEHPREMKANDLAAGFRPRIVGATSGVRASAEVIDRPERRRRGFGARDERRFGVSPGTDRPKRTRLGQTGSRGGFGLVR